MVKRAWWGVLLVLCVVAPASAARQVGRLSLEGELDGAAYRIEVPAVWNGTLLVYAHGYRDKADHPGEVDDLDADIAPSEALVPVLLAQGSTRL